MTVGELIKRLQEYPPHWGVAVEYDGDEAHLSGINDVELCQTTEDTVMIRLNINL